MKAAGKVAVSVLGWLVFLAVSPLLGFLFALASGVVAAWYCIVIWQTERVIARAALVQADCNRLLDLYLAETKRGEYDQQILRDPATLRRARSRLAPGSRRVN